MRGGGRRVGGMMDRPQEASVGGAAGAARSVLLIDDDPAARGLFRSLLAEAVGCVFAVEEASSALAGLQRIQLTRPDCVLLDYQLPDLDGLEFLARLRASMPHPPPVIMLTGAGDERIVRAALEAGACDYLVKAVTQRYELQAAVETAIERAAEEPVDHAAVLEQPALLARLDAHPEAVLLLGARDQGVLHVNPAACRLFGLEQVELLDMNIGDLCATLAEPAEWTEVQRQAWRDGVSLRELEYRLGGARPRTLQGSFSVVEQGGGPLVLAVLTDIGARVALRSGLVPLTAGDALTGLHNREFFERVVHDEWRDLRPDTKGLSLLMLQLDDLDALVRHHGDAVVASWLRVVALRLSAKLRRGGDLLAHYGGGHFAALLGGTDAAGAGRVGAQMLEAVREPATVEDGATVQLVCSVGCATGYPGGEYGADGLLRQAFAALRVAQQEGGNRCISGRPG